MSETHETTRLRHAIEAARQLCGADSIVWSERVVASADGPAFEVRATCGERQWGLMSTIDHDDADAARLCVYRALHRSAVRDAAVHVQRDHERATARDAAYANESVGPADLVKK